MDNYTAYLFTKVECEAHEISKITSAMLSWDEVDEYRLSYILDHLRNIQRCIEIYRDIEVVKNYLAGENISQSPEEVMTIALTLAGNCSDIYYDKMVAKISKTLDSQTIERCKAKVLAAQEAQDE